MKNKDMFNELLDSCSLEELLLLQKQFNNTPKKELSKKIEKFINVRDQNLNKKVFLYECSIIPNSVIQILFEHGIVTMDDLIKSGFKDNSKTDHWIEWCYNFLDMNKTFDKMDRKR